MKNRIPHTGFTLVEVLIVVVIMAILAAAIIPQFTDSTADAHSSTIAHNLRTLRSQIQLYRAQHNSVNPSAALIELTKSTNAAGTQGTGASYPLGPYIRQIPANSITNSNAVKSITNDPALAGDVTAGGAGWLYNATTSNIWIDHADHFTK